MKFIKKVENGFLMLKKSKIIVTGGTDDWRSFKKKLTNTLFSFKKEFDILNLKNGHI